MTNKELLELAAKAAGYEFLSYDDVTEEAFCRTTELGTFIWAPQGNDGDALRLAVSMKIDLFFGVDSVNVYFSEGELEVDFNGNPAAATRRAIVLAVAEIGRNMK